MNSKINVGESKSTPSARGENVDILTLKFNKTHNPSVFRCCALLEGSTESKKVFCGKHARWVAFTENGYMALCGEDGHVPIHAFE